MTNPTYEEYIGGDETRYTEGGIDAIEPIPVREVSEKLTPEMVSCMTWLIPQAGAGLPVSILQRRIRRSKAKISVVQWGTATSIVFSPKLDTVQGAIPQGATYFPIQSPGAQGASLTANGSAAIVGAGQLVTSLALPAGTWVINWAMLLAGTTSAADDNNMQLLLGATPIPAISLNGTSINTTYSQLPVTVIVPPGGATLNVQSITAGSGTATYKAQVAVTSGSSSGTPQFLPDWENQKPLYAICVGGTGALVSVQDEAYSG